MSWLLAFQRKQFLIECRCLAVVWNIVEESITGGHDDVIKWKHFPRYWPFVREICAVTGDFPAQRPVTRSFDDFFDLRLNKRLSKQAGDLRGHRAHLNVIVMLSGYAAQVTS